MKFKCKMVRNSAALRILCQKPFLTGISKAQESESMMNEDIFSIRKDQLPRICQHITSLALRNPSVTIRQT